MPNKYELCEVCGSKNCSEKKLEEEYCTPYSSPVSITTVISVCQFCGAEIDLTEDNIVERAFAISSQTSTKNILAHLKNIGYSFSHIERVFGLPQKTMSKWEYEESPLPSVAAAFLLALRTHPAIIDKADNQFT